MEHQALGKRIREERLKLNLTQERLAEDVNLSTAYIGQVERGEKNATIESIEKICIALNFPLEVLFNKIISTDYENNTAQKCYDLIVKQPSKEQQSLYILIEDIIKFKHN